jgi:hypothetical protein
MRCCMGVLTLVVGLAGCGGSTQWYQPLKVGSPTENLGLEFDLTNSSEQQYARYQVRTDGRVLFWGGQDAVFDRVTWEGMLNREQAEELTELVRGGDWLTDPPRGDGEGDDVWTISVLEPDRRRDFTVHGHAIRVDEVWALLQSAASQRFQDVLDALPKPNLDTFHQLQPATAEDQEL